MTYSRDESPPELMLAQEQSITKKSEDGGAIQGTLILTSSRLIFVAAIAEEDFRVSLLPMEMARLRFASIEDLAEVSRAPSNLSVPLSELETEKGREGIIRLPTLKIKWREGGVEKAAEFVEDIAGSGRRKDLKDWARVIDSLKAGTLKIQYPSAPIPPKDTLEGRILFVLGDMQKKGVFEIEEQVEHAFNLDLDPDAVDSACQSLVSKGFADKSREFGDNFYRKRSPLGEDDLSS